MDELQDQVGQITAPCCSDEIFKGSFASYIDAKDRQHPQTRQYFGRTGRFTALVIKYIALFSLAF